MGFSRQEDWNGLPFPSPGDIPYPGIEPASFSDLVTHYFDKSQYSWKVLEDHGHDTLPCLP